MPAEAANFLRQAQQLRGRVEAIAAGMVTLNGTQNAWAAQNLQALQASLRAGEDAIARHGERNAITGLAMATGDRQALTDAQQGATRWVTMLTAEAVVDLQGRVANLEGHDQGSVE